MSIDSKKLKSICKQLDKYNIVEIEPICPECISDIIYELLFIYPSLKMFVNSVEDNIFSITIVI